MPIKLNLGCGHFKLKGFVNVDNYADCQPDIVHDLNHTPWPWSDNAADEIILSHVLEHIGGGADIFKTIIQEIYRVGQNGAKIKIGVPDPNHDNYYGDPTHVRPITPQQLYLFSRAFLQRYKGTAITPLAVMWGVDFDVVHIQTNLDKQFKEFADSHQIAINETNLRFFRNAVLDHEIDLKLVKPPRPY